MAVGLLDLAFVNPGRLRPRMVRKGEFLAREGDASNHVFRVRSGGLMLLSEHEDGSFTATDWAGPKSLCGLEDAVCRMPYRCSYRATAPTAVECLPAAALRHTMEADPAFALGVATYLSDRVRFFSRHTELLAHGGIAIRVRETLRILAERHVDDSDPPALRFSQGDLAALVGASRQRVNPVLTALRRAGILELKQGVVRILAVTAL